MKIKTSILLATASAVALASSAVAGEVSYASSKEVVAPAPPAPVYGTGFYFGLQGGANFYQDFGATKRFTFDGNSVSAGYKDKIGAVAGGKLGYVFGTGGIRPAIEFDGYYNGVKAAIETTVNGKSGPSANADLDSGAFMGNFLLRMNCNSPFQVYAGAGLGGWVAKASNIAVNVGGSRQPLGDSSSSSGFAWQIIGGADYYFTERFSTFLEYKFLNYQDAGVFSRNIGQQIGVVGLRFHF